MTQAGSNPESHYAGRMPCHAKRLGDVFEAEMGTAVAGNRQRDNDRNVTHNSRFLTDSNARNEIYVVTEATSDDSADSLHSKQRLASTKALIIQYLNALKLKIRNDHSLREISTEIKTGNSVNTRRAVICSQLFIVRKI